RRDRKILHLLRSDADRPEAPIALDRQGISAELIAESETHDVLERDRERDGSDGGGDEPRGPELLEHGLVGHHAHRTGGEERHHHSDQATFSNTNLPPLTLL